MMENHDSEREQCDIQKSCIVLFHLLSLVAFGYTSIIAFVLIKASLDEDDDEQSRIDAAATLFFGPVSVFGIIGTCMSLKTLFCQQNNTDPTVDLVVHPNSNRSELSITPVQMWQSFTPITSSDPYYGERDYKRATTPNDNGPSYTIRSHLLVPHPHIELLQNYTDETETPPHNIQLLQNHTDEGDEPMMENTDLEREWSHTQLFCCVLCGLATLVVFAWSVYETFSLTKAALNEDDDREFSNDATAAGLFGFLSLYGIVWFFISRHYHLQNTGPTYRLPTIGLVVPPSGDRSERSITPVQIWRSFIPVNSSDPYYGERDYNSAKTPNENELSHTTRTHLLAPHTELLQNYTDETKTPAHNNSMV